ncbi:acyl-CoA thioesterase [Cellulomonas massiliensis]|uniref:acyl-CoA thioesterase n=1 Tax=Cellulomonas massiliensis TaxID=1465811 RepID=UPI0002E12099|nr:acyl-CoA thioesterase II [Cellulomonas massiliensis]
MTDLGSITPDPMAAVLRILDVQPVPGEPDTFRGESLPLPRGRVFGGQVLAQSLLAAGRTAPGDRLPHSLHGYFLRAGVLDEPITFAVERLRDGRSFAARRTHAIQGGAPILSMIASFQEQQPGIDFSDEMPHGIPDPEDVPSAVEVLSGVDHPGAAFWTHAAAYDLRHVHGAIFLRPSEDRSGQQAVWFRARGPVPDDQLLHRALLAYACDQVMLEPVLRRAGLSWVHPGLSMASLDHAMWWHRDAHVDDWLLFVQSTPSAQGGRGLGATRVFDREGRLVASIAQEGMVRLRD